jgi:hypothetical protein
LIFWGCFCPLSKPLFIISFYDKGGIVSYTPKEGPPLQEGTIKRVRVRCPLFISRLFFVWNLARRLHVYTFKSASPFHARVSPKNLRPRHLDIAPWWWVQNYPCLKALFYYNTFVVWKWTCITQKNQAQHGENFIVFFP